MFWEEQSAVLERVAAGHVLSEILHDVVALIERQAAGMLCSIMLLDAWSGTVRTAAAPSLPKAYTSQLDGLAIGPKAGSCGAAAYLGERVVVEDIATHPNWEAYRELVAPFELRACWSSPIFSTDGRVLGTFAMYYREPRRPTEEEEAWVDAATHLASIAIVSDAATKSLRRSEAHARRLARLYAMSSAVNEAIIRERDVDVLYRSACRIVVEHGMARVAWIGLAGDPADAVAPIAHAGAAFEQVWRLHAEPGSAGRAAIATALRDGRPLAFGDLADDAAPAWGKAAVSLGLRASVIVPMRHRGATAGVLVIYSEEAGAFGEEETRVIGTLAEDIAFAIESAKTATALRQSEERLRSMIERTPDVAIQWYDDDGKIIFYNEASRRLFGWGGRSAIGKSLFELGFWDRSEEDRFADARAAAAGDRHVAPTQFRYKRPDGSEGFVVSTVFRIPLSETEQCTVCMDVDLTEHRRMEAAVRESEALRASIYDNVSDCLFYVRVEPGERYRFISVNRAFLEATGLRADAVVDHCVDEIVPPASLALVKEKYAEAIRTRRRTSWDEVSRYPSGTKYGEVSVSPIFDASGACTHLVGTVHDITERHEAEEQRRQIEAQMHEAQRLQALGTLAGGIAHDFNNLLAAIHGNLDVGLGLIEPAHPVRDLLVDVKVAAGRATDLVRRILAFGRKTEPSRELLELRPVVAEAIDLARVTLSSGTRLERTFAADVPRVLGDATQVHQVVVNLITNAAHATDERRGTIDVALDRCVLGPDGAPGAEDLPPGVYARLTVRDDGTGMDAETVRRAFEPFFTTKPEGKGTGLGLSVVHGVMRSHGGAVTLSSEVGKGTTFELFFPVAPDGAAGSV